MGELANINMAPARLEEIMDHLTKLRYMLVNVGQSEGYYTIAENPYIAQFRDVVEKLSAKVNSEGLTHFLHNQSLAVNNFKQFGAAASKMGNIFK